jgi:hypothetical protein
MNNYFLAPGAFFLGLLLPVIIAFYLLKLRRVEHNVPSVYLWRRMVRDVEANAPWQKLRYNLLMILQLLFLLFLILALARPFTLTQGAGGQAAILILDTSASMSATDMAPTRLEAARQRARQLVDDLPDTARVTIIEAGRDALVRLSSSLDRRQAYRAIEAIQAETGGSDLTVALELASAIAARQPGTEIIVLSDGRVTLPNRLALRGRLRYLPFGLTGNNQAISLLNLEQAQGGSGLTIFAQVSNYHDAPVSRRLALYADGLLVNVYDLNDIPAGGQRSILAEGLPATTSVVEGRLEGSDILPLDDQVVGVRPTTDPVRVALVTNGNLFLRTALSLLPGVELVEVEATPVSPAETPPSTTAQPAPTAETPSDPEIPEADLVIFDGVVPSVLPPSSSLLFIGPPRSTDFFTTTGIIEEPALRVLDPEDPLLTNIALTDVSIFEAIDIPLPNWAMPVLSGVVDDQSTPLMFHGLVEGRRVAVLAFHLHNSDLPLNLAFPLLIANLVDWLAPGAGGQVPASINTGDSLAFTAPEGAETALVTRPDGTEVRLEAENGRFVFTDTTQLGLYQIDTGSSDGPALFSVNLFSQQESALLPADSLPGLSSEAAGNSGLEQAGQREWWRMLAFLALGLLVGEWLVYQRAALVRLRDIVRGMLFPQRAVRPRR